VTHSSQWFCFHINLYKYAITAFERAQMIKATNIQYTPARKSFGTPLEDDVKSRQQGSLSLNVKTLPNKQQHHHACQL